MSDLASLQRQLVALEDDLATVNTALTMGDADAQELKPVLEEQLRELQQQIALAKAKAAPPPPADEAAPQPKYDMSKHPKFRPENSGTAPPPPPSEETKVVFNTGDCVMAKYSADKQWYAATIIAKTGSSIDPLYTVKFTGYPDKETKRKLEVRAVESKKRKADGPPAAAVVPPPPPSTDSPLPAQHGTVISAAPSIDPSLVQKREPSRVSDGPTRMAPAPKKLKGNRTLEKAKSNWADWQKSGPKKPVLGSSKKLGKDSQFRTPDLPNAKVGFTGSGRPMSKDQVRTKWNYGHDEPDAD